MLKYINIWKEKNRKILLVEKLFWRKKSFEYFCCCVMSQNSLAGNKWNVFLLLFFCANILWNYKERYKSKKFTFKKNLMRKKNLLSIFFCDPKIIVTETFLRQLFIFFFINFFLLKEMLTKKYGIWNKKNNSIFFEKMIFLWLNFCLTKKFWTRYTLNLLTDADINNDNRKKKNFFVGDVWTDLQKYGNTERGGGHMSFMYLYRYKTSQNFFLALRCCFWPIYGDFSVLKIQKLKLNQVYEKLVLALTEMWAGTVAQNCLTFGSRSFTMAQTDRQTDGHVW